MSKKALFIGAIASIIAINSVSADTTVTSKTYVDTTRQATIPAAGTNADRNGGGVSVVTYTLADGALGERGILEPGQLPNMQTDANKLVTVAQVSDAFQQATNLPTKTVTTRTCYQFLNGDCILWELQDTSVYGSQCNTASDCGSHCYCINHMCDCDSV